MRRLNHAGTSVGAGLGRRGWSVGACSPHGLPALNAGRSAHTLTAHCHPLRACCADGELLRGEDMRIAAEVHHAQLLVFSRGIEH